MTRWSSSDDRLPVKPDTAAPSGCAATGATICQSVPVFLSVVRSPDSDLIVELVDLVRLDGEDLLLLVGIGRIALRLDEIQVRAEARADDEQEQERSDSPHRYRLRHQVWMPARNTRPGRITIVNQAITRS